MAKYSLENLPDKNITMQFDTDWLLVDVFKLLESPIEDTIETMQVQVWSAHYEPVNIAETMLHVDVRDGEYIDANGNVISEEAEREIEQAVWSAEESGIMKAFVNMALAKLEEVLEQFSGIHVEYDYYDEDGLIVDIVAEPKGILDAKVDFDKTYVKMNLDIVHIINGMITGYGLVGIDETEWNSLNEIKEYIRTRFHWLNEYWDIYGGRKPWLSYDIADEGFDEEYFIELIRDIEQRYGLALL